MFGLIIFIPAFIWGAMYPSPAAFVAMVVGIALAVPDLVRPSSDQA